MAGRKERMTLRRTVAKATKAENRPLKIQERARRDARMIQRLKKGAKAPYSPAMMSWLSSKLDKRATKVTAEDVKALLRQP